MLPKNLGDMHGYGPLDDYRTRPIEVSAASSSPLQQSQYAGLARHDMTNYAVDHLPFTPTSSTDISRRVRSNTTGWVDPHQIWAAKESPSAPGWGNWTSPRQSLSAEQARMREIIDRNAQYQRDLAVQAQINDARLDHYQPFDASFQSPDNSFQQSGCDSRSSSRFFPEDDSLFFSEPSSNLTAETLENFAYAPIPPAPCAAGPRPPVGNPMYAGSNQADLTNVPTFLMEELKLLKLENMALRKMAEDMVRLEHGQQESTNEEQTQESCPHHAPLDESPLIDYVRRVSGASSGSRRSQLSPTAAAVAFVNQDMSCTNLPTQTSVSFEREVIRQPPIGSLPNLQTKQISRPAGSSGPIQAYSQASNDVQQQFRDDLLSQQSTKYTQGFPISSERGSTTDLQPMETISSQTRGTAMACLPAADLIQMILDKRGQEASMLLQSQTKSASQERKEEIVRAASKHLLRLCHDRHGNFLVQCLVEGQPDIAQQLCGAFVELATSQFGCHVVQKVLEGDELIRRRVTEELLRSQLEQTMVSRNSIHVWQQLLETDWTDDGFRRYLFTTINEQLKGKWAQVARQETGSIICQNIFESAKEKSDKSECMQEVLADLEGCATSQWGIWVVQHIIEHGDKVERDLAFDSLLKSAIKLSLSSTGQKAVMSALKTCSRGDTGATFLEAYVNAICQVSSTQGATRRPALVDICLSPHGIQIVTQLLTTVKQDVRDKIIAAVRKNSVLLKGSKTGMKVHQLCERARAFAGY